MQLGVAVIETRGRRRGAEVTLATRKTKRAWKARPFAMFTSLFDVNHLYLPFAGLVLLLDFLAPQIVSFRPGEFQAKINTTKTLKRCHSPKPI